MMITRLEPMDKSKFKVYLEDEFAFLLYDKDLKHYQLEEGVQLSKACYEDIMEHVIYRRAKQKALAILKHMDRTEYELKGKLSDAWYPTCVITRVMEYLREYHYLDDERFAALYLKSRKESKSKLVILSELKNKGIKKELLETLILTEYQEVEADPEEIAIKKAIAKKTRNISGLSREERQKLCAYLYRKGFGMDKIKHYLKDIE